MGFRSMFVTEDNSTVWPDWFRTKYSGLVHFPEKNGPISSHREQKEYMAWGVDFLADIQKVLREEMERERSEDTDLVLVFLHECGGITKATILPYLIDWAEPVYWRRTEGVTHSYCYGCSVVRDGWEKPENYQDQIDDANNRAHAAQKRYDDLRDKWTMELNAKFFEFVENWKKAVG